VRSIGGQELVPTLDYRGTGTVTINKPAVVESGVMRLANGTPLAPERAMVYSGVISGPGSVFLEQGAITLTANNTYTGITRISRAEVELFSDSNFGAGDVVEIAGTVDPSQRVKLLLHRRVGRRWKRERKRKLRAVDGAFGVRLRPRRRGRYRVTVKAGGVRRRRHLRVG
jgi:hypothetical protein